MTELAQLGDVPRLAGLEVADEVPAEAVAVALVLRREILGAILADDLHPALAERVHLLGRDVLRRDDDRHVRAHLGADALEVRADGLRR